jgi:hypothetical protein
MESETGVLRGQEEKEPVVHASGIRDNDQRYPTREWKHGDPGESNAMEWKQS